MESVSKDFLLLLWDCFNFCSTSSWTISVMEDFFSTLFGKTRPISSEGATTFLLASTFLVGFDLDFTRDAAVTPTFLFSVFLLLSGGMEFLLLSELFADETLVLLFDLLPPSGSLPFLLSSEWSTVVKLMARLKEPLLFLKSLEVFSSFTASALRKNVIINLLFGSKMPVVS